MKVYKIYLASNLMSSGTWNNSFYPVILNPSIDDYQYDWHIIVEAFTINQTLPNAYLVTIPNVAMQSSTFSAINKNIQSIVLLNNTSTYVNNNTYGQMIDINQFQGISLNIQILNANTGDLYSFNPNVGSVQWNLILTLHGFPKQN